MCGFAGYFSTFETVDPAALLERMGNAIQHRGPDDSGIWVDGKVGIGLVHRRLAIVDLSNAGHQPMISASGRYVIAFNGEIYNHLLLRRVLNRLSPVAIGADADGRAWRGHSDTETLLAGFDTWGIRDTIERCVGMFAFAVWDRESKTLTLARDRLGEKPLYYGWQGHGQSAAFLFGSELSAIKAHSSFTKEIDRSALSLFMRFNCVPAPFSIYAGILKLEPGCMVTLSPTTPEQKSLRYWSMIDKASRGTVEPFGGTSAQAVNSLDLLLKTVVQQEMMADVPLGAFLSGGVDSSTIVAIMQSCSARPIKTFTIGFSEADYDEAGFAKSISRHLGTEHTELYVTPSQAIDAIPIMPTLYSEPFSDSSQIPTFLVARLAREKVTVSLSGDGGDELFCGYNRYLLANDIWSGLSKIPRSFRRLAAGGIRAISTERWNALSSIIPAVLPASLRQSNFGDKMHKGAGVLSSDSIDTLYFGLVSHWHDPASVVIGGSEPTTLLTSKSPALQAMNDIQRMMVMDSITYLPDDILTKVDRACMGVSLEGRVPFLDHRLVEFAWSLPQSLKLRNGVTKWVLREVLYRYVPRELIERPKMGFGVPIGEWLRGPLKDWAEELLDETRLRSEGYFYPAPIRKKWAEHLSGKRNWQYHLWDVLMFQAWLADQ